jgi:hypothetical protein
MAITRTAWIDDDGTGTTGTVINNAEKTLLYNQIDAALAGLLPAAGGVISGNLQIQGRLALNQAPDAAAMIGVTCAASTRGALIIGATDGYAAIQVHHPVNAATAYVAYFQNTGAANGQYLANTGAWVAVSDRRRKTDIRPLAAIDGLRQLQPRDFQWAADVDDPARRHYGFIAQEVEDVYPNLITPSPDGLLGVAYTGLIAPLVEGWQDHDQRLARLEALAAGR